MRGCGSRGVVADPVTSSSPVPLKARRVGKSVESSNLLPLVWCSTIGDGPLNFEPWPSVKDDTLADAFYSKLPPGPALGVATLGGGQLAVKLTSL
ncbi:hypothetical protein TNCV_544681 [Trichonephila clavipes]|nr:hypothetical protein TNCV_544681 [Trichonephila clavipes]